MTQQRVYGLATQQTLGLANRVMLAAVALVPFQQAFTVNVGFPLKLTEILAALSLGMVVLEGARARYAAPGVRWAGAIVILIAVSSVAVMYMTPPGETAPGYWRNLNGDMWLYTGYAAFAVAFFYVLATRLGADRIRSGIRVAVKLAAAYCVIQLVTHLFGADPLSALNGATQVGGAYGLSLPRNGSFLEGNYLGFFAGGAVLVVWGTGDWVARLAAVFCLLYSQSTTGIVALVASALVLAMLRPSHRVFGVIAGIAAVGSIAYLVIPEVHAFVFQQLSKLQLVDLETRASAAHSVRARTASAQAGLKMAREHPWLGVGAGRYGYAYESDPYRVDIVSTYTVTRPIANNAYVQVMAEQGFIVFGVFCMFLLRLVWGVLRAPRELLALAVFLLVGIAATPAWTALPIWLFFAYLAASGAKPVDETRLVHGSRGSAYRRIPPRVPSGA